MKKTLLTLLLLTSCAPDVIYKPQTVEVPVPVKCVPPAVSHPAFPLQSVPADADIFTKVQSALAEIDMRTIYEAKLEASLKACGG